jgi:hypothetical protein
VEQERQKRNGPPAADDSLSKGPCEIVFEDEKSPTGVGRIRFSNGNAAKRHFQANKAEYLGYLRNTCGF